MLKNILTTIQNKYNNLKNENDTLNQLLKTTTTFQNLFPIPQKNNDYSEHKITYITNTCPDINKEKAEIIAKLIPIDEVYLTILYTKELLTNQEYFLIPTNKYLWIITPKTFGAIPYQNQHCQIIKNNLMSKVILLNNILLEATGNDNKIQNFLDIINNPQKRQEIIVNKTNYLCQITPIYQKINAIGSGISIDSQKNIVFHTKEQNQKFNINDIENYEILIDNQSFLSKNSHTSKKITNFYTACYQISIRITIKNGSILILPILEPSAFGNRYQKEDTIFQTNLNFAKIIFDKINELNSLNSKF